MDKDFREGDKVTVFSELGTHQGYISGLDSDIPGSARVRTSEHKNYWYLKNFIFHGHNVRIEGEEIPERTRVVFLKDGQFKYRGGYLGRSHPGIYIEAPEDLANQLEAYFNK